MSSPTTLDWKKRNTPFTQVKHGFFNEFLVFQLDIFKGTTDYMDRFIDEQDPSRDRSSSPTFYSLMFGSSDGRKGLSLYPGSVKNLHHYDSNGTPSEAENTQNSSVTSNPASSSLLSSSASDQPSAAAAAAASSASTNGRLNEQQQAPPPPSSADPPASSQ